MSTSQLRSEMVQFEFDGRQVLGRPGQSVAAALWAVREAVLRTTAEHQAPRGYFCGMGVCFDCLVTIDGRPNCQACLVPIAAGMQVTRQGPAGTSGTSGTESDGGAS